MEKYILQCFYIFKGNDDYEADTEPKWHKMQETPQDDITEVLEIIKTRNPFAGSRHPWRIIKVIEEVIWESEKLC